ncbi:redox-sensitive transcriptional activator SoxR [Photobacterium leiognathi]|uniref:redox-sensitive transcriptional activator SoxR n=1 Tax=Photobacterium leiognathi TaxID=553611 RepID=UPI0029813946|nr:redox-sensitive transcriptional activator SoxR [Photobacterium leiognathi]
MELSVGQIAKRAGVSVSTLHFYEQKELIISYRTASNQRRYKRSVLRRIAVIKAAQSVGLTLQEIKQALAHIPLNENVKKEQWEQLSTIWHQKLEEKMHELKQLQTQLGSCIQCGCLSMESCALYNNNDSNGIMTAGAKLSAPK